MALNPKLDEPHHELGVVYFHIGLFDKAQAEIEKALAIRPTNTIARFRLGVINIYRGKYEDALAVVEDYLKTYPNDEAGNVTSVKAMLLAKADKMREAEDTIQHAIEIGKDFGHFHHTAYNIAVRL